MHNVIRATACDVPDFTTCSFVCRRLDRLFIQPCKNYQDGKHLKLISRSIYVLCIIIGYKVS